MSKIKTLLAVMLLTPATMFAGGVLTNTNQNAAFLRQFSQDAVIDITGLYCNPAGTAFLSNGWHLSLNSQSAWQQRNITTTFPLFAYNVNTLGVSTHKFEGRAKAPVIPSFQLSYNHDKWSVNASFAVSGGGGKCEFDNGLGSFEALYSGQLYNNLLKDYMSNAVPNLMNSGMTQEEANAQALANGKIYADEHFNYSLNTYMRGKQYYFGLQIGATYKVMENLSVFAGLRGVYASCNYYGFVQDVKYYIDGNPTSVPKKDLTLNCDQTGIGFTPILGIDWKINEHWNVAAKYEFKTRMRLKNSSHFNDYGNEILASTDEENEQARETLAQFADGAKVAADIPGTLMMGAQYSPIKSVRINGGFHYYFDDSATAYNNKNKLLENTWEITAGAEYDVCKWLTVSGSYQLTKYGSADEYMNDMSFNVNSNAIGLGVRVNATPRCSIDLGYMHCFYDDRTVNTLTPVGVIKTDVYERTNDVFGIGVNLHF